MMNQTKIVIIPTYNEFENISELLGKIMRFPGEFDVLIIDDNSPDGTADLVKSIQVKFPERIHLLERKGKTGLGAAYISGFKCSLDRDYDYIFEMDADFSHNPRDLLKLYKACAGQDFDMAIGSRYITGVNVVNWPM